MQVIYCVCGGKTEYSTIKPKLCGCCGVEMGKISIANIYKAPASSFRTQLPQKEAFVPRNQLPQRAIVSNRISQSYDTNIIDPDGLGVDEEGFKEEGVDTNKVKFWSKQMAASINPSDFIITTHKNSVRGSELPRS